MIRTAPISLLAIKLICTIVAFLFALLRAYLLFRYRTLTVRNVTTQALLLLTCCLITSATGIALPGLVEEARLESSGRYSEEELQELVSTPGHMKIFIAGHILYTLAIAALKASTLVFYSELFSNIPTRKRLAVYAAACMWAVGYAAALVLQLVYCWPISNNWAPTSQLPIPNCPAPLQPAVFATVSAVNISTDVVILIVPLLAIFSLRLRRVELLGLALVFTIGGTAIVFSIVRLALVWPKLKGPSTRQISHQVMLFSCLEVFPAVVAFCLPCLRWMMAGDGKSRGNSHPGSGGSVETRGRRKKLVQGDSETRLTLYMEQKEWRDTMERVERESKRMSCQSWVVAAGSPGSNGNRAGNGNGSGNGGGNGGGNG